MMVLDMTITNSPEDTGVVVRMGETFHLCAISNGTPESCLLEVPKVLLFVHPDLLQNFQKTPCMHIYTYLFSFDFTVRLR